MCRVRDRHIALLVAYDEAAGGGPGVEAEVAQSRVQLGEAQGGRDGLGHDLAGTLQDGRHPGPLLAAHLAHPARPCAARRLLPGKEEERPRSLGQTELPLLLPQRALQAKVVHPVVPPQVGPRMDQVHHAVEVLVWLVPVRDDDGLVVGQVQVGQRAVRDGDHGRSGDPFVDRKADLQVVDGTLHHIVLARFRAHLARGTGDRIRGDVPPFPPLHAVAPGAVRAPLQVPREGTEIRFPPAVPDHAGGTLGRGFVSVWSAARTISACSRIAATSPPSARAITRLANATTREAGTSPRLRRLRSTRRA